MQTTNTPTTNIRTLTVYANYHSISNRPEAWIFQHTEEGNTWVKTIAAAKRQNVDLSHANLQNVDLTGVDFSGMQLVEANLDDTILREVNFEGANLTSAKMRFTYAGGTNFRGANLTKACLSVYEDVAFSFLADLTDAQTEGLYLFVRQGTRHQSIILSTDSFLHAQRDMVAKMKMVSRQEVEGLRALLIAGKINGTLYEGECCCFVGSLEKLAKQSGGECSVLRRMSSPVEQWFVNIREGSTPENCAMSALTLKWIDDFLSQSN